MLKRQLHQSEQVIEEKNNIIFIHEQTLKAQQNISPPTAQTSTVIDVREAEQIRILCVLCIVDS